jgi:hypothetical protein
VKNAVSNCGYEASVCSKWDLLCVSLGSSEMLWREFNTLTLVSLILGVSTVRTATEGVDCSFICFLHRSIKFIFAF